MHVAAEGLAEGRTHGVSLLADTSEGYARDRVEPRIQGLCEDGDHRWRDRAVATGLLYAGSSDRVLEEARWADDRLLLLRSGDEEDRGDDGHSASQDSRNGSSGPQCLGSYICLDHYS